MATQNLTANTLINGNLTPLLGTTPGYTSFSDLINNYNVAAAKFVDLSAISDAFGTTAVTYDPSAPTNINITNGFNSVSETYSTTNVSDSTYGNLLGYSKTFDVMIGNSITFHGLATRNSNNSNGSSKLVETQSFVYENGNGTGSTLDDVRASFSDTRIEERIPGSTSTEFVIRNTENFRQSYSNSNYSLSETSNSISVANIISGANGLTWMPVSADFARTYSFSSASDHFSVSYNDNVHVNNYGVANVTYSSVEWSTKDYSATVEGSFSNTFNFDPSVLPNTGSLRSNNISSVYSDFQQSFLPNFLAQDNVFEVTNNSGVSITTGGGNDQLFGGQGYDTAVFDFSSNDITSIALGNNGLDLAIKTGMEEKYLHGFEQLNFTDRSFGVQEFMSSDAARSLIEGPNNIASADLSSWVNSSSYAQNSGLTNQLAAPSA
jgi:hypothetical protein